MSTEKRILCILAGKPDFDHYCLCCGFFGFKEEFIWVEDERNRVPECPRCRSSYEYIFAPDPDESVEKLKHLLKRRKHAWNLGVNYLKKS